MPKTVEVLAQQVNKYDNNCDFNPWNPTCHRIPCDILSALHKGCEKTQGFIHGGS